MEVLVWNFLFDLFFFFLELQVRHMEVPRLGAVSDLQLLDYTTAYSNTRSLTYWMEARDRTYILMETSRVHFPTSSDGHNRSFSL